MPSFPRYYRALLLLAAGGLARPAGEGSAQAPQAGAGGEIAGVIVAAESGQPLAAAVLVEAAADTGFHARALANADGRFRLAGLPDGRFAVRVILLGYASPPPREVALTAASPRVELDTLRMRVDPVALAAVEARAERSAVVVAGDRTIYAATALPASAGGTATDLLRQVPELAVDPDGKVWLRGSASVAIQVNGRPAPVRGEALQAYLLQLPANRVDRVEVVPNPSARNDPEGMAGIVNIVLKSDADLGGSGTVAAYTGTRTTGTYVGLARQQGALALFGSGSYSGSRSSSSSHDLRENLLATPVTFLDQQGQTSNHGRFATVDLSADLRGSARATAWASLTGTAWTYDGDGSILYALEDSALAPLTRFDQHGSGGSTRRSGDAVAGMKYAIEARRHELTVEARASGGADVTDARYLDQLLGLDGVPLPDPERLSVNTIDANDRQLSLQADYVRPLGRPRRLESGVRVLDRRTSSDQAQEVFAPAAAVAPSHRLPGGFLHRERFQSAYVTLRQELGPVAFQAGMRAENAATDFRVGTTGRSYDDRYLSFFPSANLSVPLGGGRRLRLAYSRRIERPIAYLLNPDVPVTDSLNRTQGNPELKPKYTHNVTADLSWTGRRGLLRLSPFYRRVVDNWDQIKRVDAQGISVLTFENVAAVSSWGAYASGSLPGDRRLGGYASVGAFREVRDASNLSTAYSGSALRWTASSNGSFKATPSLTLQASGSYSPARDLPQGRISATVVTGAGARQQLGRQAWLNITVTDPFGIWRYSFQTRDWTHTQSSDNRFSMRGVTAYFSYSFGKPPKNRTTPEPQQPQPDVRIH